MIAAPYPHTLLARYAPVALADLESVALLDRTDTKYLLTVAQLSAALEAVAGDYRVLEVGGARLHHYRTLYFDTPDLTLFRHHHAGKAVRHKVRSRAYVDTGLSFLEVKEKNNKGRTVKHRIPTDGLVSDLHSQGGSFVAAHAPVEPGALQPALWNDFHRITLVGTRHAERLTVDLGLSFQTDARHTATLPGIAIAELKQNGVDRTSPFMRQMRAAHVQPAGMSKYCVGVSLLHEGVRHNAFKPTLRAVEKLMEAARREPDLG
ncbi:MAG: hypothetical protein AVDCRST_MAG77-2203 [uncultured Chloroflexi bacterium]|uniref:VTC domain-containing protein n=1 Tax=uncultured Chloroflexota bacterium TaxID=166587 RepID=A0A6J4IHR6_9CHLR|nr:MAG: hypothetical protein AVDCRST_MAG77-2203 [uncultured Chloroflexota bacterium]